MDMATTILVGRVRGRNYSTARLKQWVAEIWSQHFVDFPFVQTFVRGWFALIFAREKHTNWLLSSFWHIEQAPVMLRRWSPLFDPNKEQVGAGQIWLRLPSLPLQFWTEDIFRRI